MVTGEAGSGTRALERLERLYTIGSGDGANRPGLSREEQEACELTAGWMRDAGLDVRWDPGGNLLGALPGSRPELPEVWTGSHLDSVPRGGRFDGPLGVVAGLEATAALARRGPFERTVCVVAFRDEEGSRFGMGCFGSRALCGEVEEEELELRDREGRTRHAALRAMGLELPLGGWLDRAPGVFLEAHVEQGPRLAEAGAPLGLVAGIAGLARGSATFIGAPGHAGTTPMAGRDDALCAAAAFVLAVRQAASSIPGAVATVGAIAVEAGAANVIPGRAVATVDARAPSSETFDRLTDSVAAAAAHAGGGLELRRKEPVSMAPGPTGVLRRELERLGLPAPELASGAGHDAGILAAAGVDTAMLFVRSLAGGVSHSPEELTSEEDVVLCVSVLEAALARLAGAASPR